VRRGVRLLARSWLYVQTRFNRAAVDRIEHLQDEVSGLRAEVLRMHERQLAMAAESAAHADRMALRHAAALDALRDGLIDQLRVLANQETAGLEALRAPVTALGDRLQHLEADLAAQQQLGDRLRHLEPLLAAQQRRLSWLLGELRHGMPRTGRDATRLTAGLEPADLDALYASLEDSFRGSRSEIKQRARVYLPVVEEAQAAVGGNGILDLGCGRGEWLELVGEEGRSGRGVDLNRLFVEECRRRGLDVVEADVLAFLPLVPDESVGVVTAFHLIEHLPFDAMLELMDESLRVLRPGGLAIFETPNPENVVVSTHTFHLDPTHRNLVPSLLLTRLLGARGFSRVDVVKLHAAAEAGIEEPHLEVARRFNAFFYGPRDYAVLAWKPQ
jgi:O-antigen chain-terminating methyltransferase